MVVCDAALQRRKGQKSLESVRVRLEQVAECLQSIYIAVVDGFQKGHSNNTEGRRFVMVNHGKEIVEE